MRDVRGKGLRDLAGATARRRLPARYRRGEAFDGRHVTGLARTNSRSLRKVVAHDIAIMKRILDFLSVSPEAQAYAQVENIAQMLPDLVTA
jgi:hypothetical protein